MFNRTYMRRRDFIAAVGAAAIVGPRGAWGQQPTLPVVGILDSTDGARVFRSSLSEAGYTEGRTVAIELRAANRNEQLPAFAAELVQRKVSIIAALGGFAAHAAKAATATIPVVFSIGGDPVELGLVDSLNRPGGNVTGVTFFAAQLLQKQVGLLRELVPRATVLGFLVNPDNPRAQADVSRVQVAARSLGLEPQVVNASSESDLDAAFSGLVRLRADALIVGGDALTSRASTRIAALAMLHALPLICGTREIVEAGALMAYVSSRTDAYHQAGIYAGRILKGEKTADLPVVQPTKFELVINLNAARALGLSVPSKLLFTADEVIE